MVELTNETWNRIGKLQQRAETDPHLRQQLEADPRQVLEDAGIPTAGLRIARDTDRGDVVGHAMKNDDRCVCVLRDPVFQHCLVAICA